MSISPACAMDFHLWERIGPGYLKCADCGVEQDAPEPASDTPATPATPAQPASPVELDDSAWDRLIEAASAVAMPTPAPSNAAGQQSLAALYQQAVAVGVIQPTTTYK